MEASKPLWAITAHFNPEHDSTRLNNFRRFRKALDVPLLAVELGYSGSLELNGDDADILVQLRGDSVLWQKERLLNVAAQALPPHVEYVAWLDSDIEFLDASWPYAAVQSLAHNRLVQLFEHLIDLEPDSTAKNPGFLEHTGKSFVAFELEGGPKTKELRPGKRYRPRCPGAAWAARRALIERHGLYDALILGAGDAALALSAYGKFDELVQVAKLNTAQQGHYLAWARPFYADVQGRVGVLKGTIFHFWHGALSSRFYRERNEGLIPFDFDPYADIRIDDQGCFVWASDKPALHALVRTFWTHEL